MNIIERFKNQRVAQKIFLKNHKKGSRPARIQNCFRLKTNTALNVNLKKKEAQKRANYDGLQTCGSVWNCSPCSTFISEHRKDHLQKAFDIWRSKDPCNVAIMATFTTPHYIFQSLKEVLNLQDRAIRIMKQQPQRSSHKVWRTIMEEMASIGSYTGRESGFGKNGWHPHRHESYLAVRGSNSDLIQWQKNLTWAFYIAFKKAGGVVNDFDAFWNRSVRLDQITDDDGFDRVSSYITKVEGEKWTLAQEMTKGIVKTAKNGNITPFGMLDAIRQGDPNSGLYSYKFYEYATTMHGKKQFFPTHGLNHFLGLNWKTDDEILETQKGGSHYATITDQEWEQIINLDIRGEILQLTENRNEFEFLSEMENLLQQYQLEKTG